MLCPKLRMGFTKQCFGTMPTTYMEGHLKETASALKICLGNYHKNKESKTKMGTDLPGYLKLLTRKYICKGRNMLMLSRDKKR